MLSAQPGGRVGVRGALHEHRATLAPSNDEALRGTVAARNLTNRGDGSSEVGRNAGNQGIRAAVINSWIGRHAAEGNRNLTRPISRSKRPPEIR